MRPLAPAHSPDVEHGATVVVPVGAVEQHGAHLPLDTDTAIAEAVAHGVAERLPGDAFLAPAIAFGASGEHQDFPGTGSIGTAALRLVLVELVRSLRTWAGRVVLVNGHGGNVPALRSAVGRLVEEGHAVTWVPCDPGPGADAHAGRTETSLMLHLRPASVRLDRAVAGTTTPLEELMPAMLAGGVAAVSPCGVLGDPAGANAEEGRLLLTAMVDRALARLSASPAPTLGPGPEPALGPDGPR